MRKFVGYEKGVNIGGWMSQCKYTDEHIRNFITEKDFKKMSEWGLDHVRIPVDYNIFMTDNGDIMERGFRYVQFALDMCEKYKLNMILDLHKTMGFFFDAAHQEKGFFDSEILQVYFYQIWDEFSRRYGKYSSRLTFELLNEVTEPEFSKKWNAIAKKAIEVIRANAPDIKIIIGSYWNISVDALADLDMPYDENIVYTYHCYDPFLFTHQGAYWVDLMPNDFRISYSNSVKEFRTTIKNLGLDYMQTYEEVMTENFDTTYFENRFINAVKLCEERNVPLYCGEYGVINLANADDTLNWYKDINTAFEKFGIGRAAWCYKEVDYGLSDTHMESVIDELVKYL